MSWRLLDGATVAAQGEFPDRRPAPRMEFAVGHPTELIDGHTYELVVDVGGTVVPFGEFPTTRLSKTIRWDESIEADLTTLVKDGDVWVAGDTFYPAWDRYLDLIRFVPVSPAEELSIVGMTVRDAAGEVVDALFTGGNEWSGVASDGVAVSAGVYTVEAVVRDLAGNQAIATAQVTLDDARVVRKLWRRAFVPADTIVRREVENCGRLRRPARAAWPGSLGLDSTACPNGGRSRVTVLNQVDLPDSFYGERGPFRVTVVGAAARSRPRSRLQVTYEGNVFRAGNVYGMHHGPWHEGGAFPAKGAVLEWTASVEGRAKYDIRKFIVESTYHVLE